MRRVRMGAGRPLVCSARGEMARRVTGPGANGQAAAPGEGLGLGEGWGASVVAGGGGGGCVGDPLSQATRTDSAAQPRAARKIRDMAASARGKGLPQTAHGCGRDECPEEGRVAGGLLDLVDEELRR